MIPWWGWLLIVLAGAWVLGAAIVGRSVLHFFNDVRRDLRLDNRRKR